VVGGGPVSSELGTPADRGVGQRQITAESARAASTPRPRRNPPRSAGSASSTGPPPMATATSSRLPSIAGTSARARHSPKPTKFDLHHRLPGFHSCSFWASWAAVRAPVSLPTAT